ncbi:hypothetical protein LCGC14_2774400 [marine sediment metagenome]|uniref:Uncharacterized protein n=1 Tax=marine sediment metagenome TaxID=412755 RepID=A0A0F8YV42_9ZZZZ
MSFTQNGWFNLLRLGLFETASFMYGDQVYGDQVNVKYSKEYALDVSSRLNRMADQYMK